MNGANPMTVNFHQLEAAKHDPAIAKVLRLRFGLDESKSGRVFVDEEEIQERLAAGTLPPVLSSKQFARLSQGLPYGDLDSDDLGTISEVLSAQESVPQQRSPYAEHPEYREFAQLSGPVSEALRGDFKNFLFLKRRGVLQGVIDDVHARLANDARVSDEQSRKRAHERAIKEAGLRDPEQYRAAASRLAKSGNYPGLKVE